MTTLREVRTKVEYVNQQHGTTLHVERHNNYYNVYINGGQQVGTAHTAREAYNIVQAFETGLKEAEAIMAVRLHETDKSSYKGEDTRLIKELQMDSERGWHDHDH
jgi:hypothetical protein